MGKQLEIGKGMKTFIYKEKLSDGGRTQLVYNLNEWGQEGWQPVLINHIVPDIANQYYNVILQKEFIDESPVRR